MATKDVQIIKFNNWKQNMKRKKKKEKKSDGNP